MDGSAKMSAPHANKCRSSSEPNRVAVGLVQAVALAKVAGPVKGEGLALAVGPVKVDAPVRGIPAVGPILVADAR